MPPFGSPLSRPHATCSSVSLKRAGDTLFIFEVMEVERRAFTVRGKGAAAQFEHFTGVLILQLHRLDDC